MCRSVVLLRFCKNPQRHYAIVTIDFKLTPGVVDKRYFDYYSTGRGFKSRPVRR